MPKPFEIRAIVALVQYLEDDEEKHWEEEDKPLKHIYQDVMVVKRYLIDLKNKSKKT